jgi:DNA polymerase III epsilon subunit-like protein
MFHYNCFDCETTGLDERVYDLLTAYFAVFDQEFNFLEDFDLVTGPSRDLKDYRFEVKAMQVNKINLEDHVRRPEFLAYADAAASLRGWLESMKAKYRPGRGATFIALGQNVNFDIDWLQAKLGLTRDEWERHFNRRPRDTSSNATFLKDAGIIPEHINGLSGLCEHFGIKTGEAHVAKDDVHMTARLYKRQLELLRGRRDQMSGIPADVLRLIEG